MPTTNSNYRPQTLIECQYQDCHSTIPFAPMFKQSTPRLQKKKKKFFSTKNVSTETNSHLTWMPNYLFHLLIICSHQSTHSIFNTNTHQPKIVKKQTKIKANSPVNHTWTKTSKRSKYLRAVNLLLEPLGMFGPIQVHKGVAAIIIVARCLNPEWQIQCVYNHAGRKKKQGKASEFGSSEVKMDILWCGGHIPSKVGLSAMANRHFPHAWVLHLCLCLIMNKKLRDGFVCMDFESDRNGVIDSDLFIKY